MKTTTAILQTQNLGIGYRAQRQPAKMVGDQINLTMLPGQLVCLIGPNGAGKSTLLRTLAGLQQPIHGEVLLDGANLHKMRPRTLARSISVVLTDRIVTGMLTAYDVASLGRDPYTGWSGILTLHDHEVVRRALKSVHAEAFANRVVHELSDGERQRVMMARALAQEPRLMILDEITAFLDLPGRVEAMTILRNVARHNNCAVLLSTHDLDLALRTADRIWLFPKGGEIKAGTPEELIWNGAFAAAFAASGISFNSRSGTFQVEEPSIGVAYVEGEDLHATWTSRALERHGFRTTTDAGTASVHIEIQRDSEQVRWVCRSRNGIRSCNSIDEVLASLPN